MVPGPVRAQIDLLRRIVHRDRGVLGEGHGELEFNRVEDSDVASAEPPVKVRKVHHADSASKYTTPMKVTVL